MGVRKNYFLQLRKNIKLTEFTIFSFACFILIKSVYNLIVPKHTIGSRSPSSLQSHTLDTPTSALSNHEDKYFTYETSCLASGENISTQAEKLRIYGKICGLNSKKQPNLSLIDLKAENINTQYVATIFQDAANFEFSTDYIPLQNGLNSINLDFIYHGKEFHRASILIKKE